MTGTRLNQLSFSSDDATALNATAEAMAGANPEMTAVQWQVAYLALMSNEDIRSYTTNALNHLREMQARLDALDSMIGRAKTSGAPTFEVDALQDAYDSLKAANDRVYNPATDEGYTEPEPEPEE